MSTLLHETISLPNTPAIPGLIYRGFAGEADLPKMLAVINGSKTADGIQRSETLDEITRNYSHLTNCDPYIDMLIPDCLIGV